jgi:hypothetical protein
MFGCQIYCYKLILTTVVADFSQIAFKVHGTVQGTSSVLTSFILSQLCLTSTSTGVGFR